MQLSPGQAHLLQAYNGRKPALVLRTDVANVYGAEVLCMCDVCVCAAGVCGVSVCKCCHSNSVRYGSPPAPHLFSELIEDAVLQYVAHTPHTHTNMHHSHTHRAVRLDAAAVCVNLLKVDNHPDSDKLHQQCVRNIMKLKVDCEHYGMPLMVEPLCMKMVEVRTNRLPCVCVCCVQQ